MSNKIFAFLLGLALCLIMPLRAGDFGLTLKHDSGLTGGTGSLPDIEQIDMQESALLWGHGRVGENLTVQGSGGFLFEFPDRYLLKLESLKAGAIFTPSGLPRSAIQVTAGRLDLSDISGKVWRHKGDGLQLQARFQAVTVTASAVYTGLIPTFMNDVIMSQSDLAAYNHPQAGITGTPGAPRMAEMVTAVFPEIAAGQTLALCLLFQQDLRSDDELVTGGQRLHTQYAGLCLSGPLTRQPHLFYRAFLVGNGGQYGGDTIRGFLGGGDISYYRPDWRRSRFRLSFLYSSGDADHDNYYEGNTGGFSTAFVPISGRAPGIILSPKHANLFYALLGYSLKPFSRYGDSPFTNSMLTFNNITLFRSTAGPISSNNIESAADDLYLGNETNIRFLLRPTSDLGLSLTGALLIPSRLLTVAGPQWEFRAALSFTL